MSLFQIPTRSPISILNSLESSTPFGTLQFELTINDKQIKNFKPVETISFQNSIVSSWCVKECRIEFLITPFQPKIPSGMHVETCLAGIWRIKCLSKNASIIFKTYLKMNPMMIFENYIETGEGLVSMAFENAEWIMNVGTEDEDYLNCRAMSNKWMPNRFKDNIQSDNIQQFSNGLEVTFPNLNEYDSIQTQFIVAWTSKKYNPSSCWFAVDQSSEHILKEASIH